MSGHSDSTICPACGNQMDTYSDYKPFDTVSGQCLHCGFNYTTYAGFYSLEEVNEIRADSELPGIDKLAHVSKENRSILSSYFSPYESLG